jgi:DNA mismatch endonuclease (patch repair protein)
MKSVKTQGTGPEMILRRALHKLGYRYTLHDRKLPGSPDLVFPRRRKAIFVDGCFWHGHKCRWGKLPKSNLDYWKPKIDANKKRDRKKRSALTDDGWKYFVVWQCELKNLTSALPKILAFLEDKE